MREEVIKKIDSSENPSELFDEFKPFNTLMMYYRCAIMEVETKFRVLNEQFSVQYNRNPIESIHTRLKKPASIMGKLKRKELPVSVRTIEENLFDIAGVRVICSFQDDIYTMADLLLQQDDIQLVEKKDYIKRPKDNGYRSLHLIVDVPIFLSNEKRHMKVEVQLRTIAMDFWASLEHKLKYKKHIQNAEEIAGRLKMVADVITEMDCAMQDIHNMIELEDGSVEELGENRTEGD
ncbi:MAG: GTP pyrophosphokinase family protein [Lachnospiraceae bacterium]|nr:GTP pyrophosphokinase family protein [Lachnospiraceae bacterium]